MESSPLATEITHSAPLSLPRWRKTLLRTLAAEISCVTRHYDQVVQWKPEQNDDGWLLELIECPQKTRALSMEDFPKSLGGRALILLNGTLNHHLDIQTLLQNLRSQCLRTTRIAVVAYSPYARGVYSLLGRLKLRSFSRKEPFTFLTTKSLQQLCHLSGFEVVRKRHSVFSPFALLGLGTLLNRLLPAFPFLKHLSFTQVIFLRPIIPEKETPSLSVVIPARNEKGNIENALVRLEYLRKRLDGKLEVIFIEGHSRDQTWEEIQRVLPLYQDRFQLQADQQKGKGKADAVRMGFSKARGDLLTILDADLTMPPEDLGRFYDAYIQGQGDFVNGNRLLYPMEGKAMRFLNLLGNIFFSKALSNVLGTHLGDTLCGTKLFSRSDYDRFISWRKEFGDFDPFGDFEMIFPAAILGLGIVDLPIRYRDRTYGATNISRFRHGLMLLKMTVIGFFKVKLGRT